MPSQDSNIYLPARKEKTCPVHSSFLPPPTHQRQISDYSKRLCDGATSPTWPKLPSQSACCVSLQNSMLGEGRVFGSTKKKCTSSCALTALLLDSSSAGFGRVGREASHLVFDLTALNASPVAWH